MSEINIGIINNKTVRKYMKNHPKLVCNKEALFVGYMKTTEGLTIEKMDILVEEYQEKRLPIIEEDYQLANPVLGELPSFKKYLENKRIEPINYEDLYYILLPAIKLYRKKDQIIEYTIDEIDDIICQLDIERPILYRSYLASFTSIIMDYRIAGQIAEKSFACTFPNIIMSKKKCRDILIEYQNIYGYENVQKVRKLVRERCVNNE